MMNIAVVFEGKLQGGGGYQQQLSTILKLVEIEKYKFFAYIFSNVNKKVLEEYGIRTVVVEERLIDKIFRYVTRQEWFYSFSPKFKWKSIFEKKLDEENIDLVYFLHPSKMSLDLLTHNYIITDWDLSHRDTPEFPEVNYFREFERREQLYTKCLKKAVAVLVDSELGKKNVVKRYGIDDNRVYPASFVPSVNAESKTAVDIKTKYKIEGEYIYYPAQFWSHKNHVYIIDSIKLLKNDGIEVFAVFSGSNKGNLEYVLNYAKMMGIENQIKYIGFAPNEEIYSLYKKSLAMVMPSYFGPTNIPPLEAFAVGTPVIYSDLEGLRDQVGDGALLCDLKNPESLADHLKILIEDSDLRESLIQKGAKRLAELRKTSIPNVLEKIFDDYSVKLKCWKY